MNSCDQALCLPGSADWICCLTGLKKLLSLFQIAHGWINANGQDLPFKDESFDLALQFTAFSSVLDPEIKRDMAEAMLRVLKPDGGVLWYDFIWNPTNSQTKGIGLKEIKSLFPGCTFLVSRITLAPPLTRLLLPKYPRLVEWLSSLIIFNSHLLVWIQKCT